MVIDKSQKEIAKIIFAKGIKNYKEGVNLAQLRKFVNSENNKLSKKYKYITFTELELTEIADQIYFTYKKTYKDFVKGLK